MKRFSQLSSMIQVGIGLAIFETIGILIAAGNAFVFTRDPELIKSGLIILATTIAMTFFAWLWPLPIIERTIDDA
ncbi:hypothetical protein [Sphingomonas prati]|uniref:ABC-type uncharacterized transport system permease subunit n=1 Tax=Sphingomonas prati TaxID=1843237 RepID=A0A7W9BVQ4_9SPHN|nr:hypothetical protein [Sphingomonas prati]MBB5730885.1 ABC-type uncharacterized transport system permease subunit [Sphingomonas prati]GGE97529.1 hypothetical protein GCM10011404_33350 [Sphingomonas prati]